MTTISDNAATSRGLLTLALLEIAGVGAVAARKILRRLNAERIGADAAVRTPDTLKHILSDANVSEYHRGLERGAEIIQKLSASGARVIVQGDADYPSRLDLLGDNAPLFLMVMGNPLLLDTHSIGFCGSRKASERGLLASADLASQLGERKVNVVSGYAAGVDTAVHTAALESGGTTAVVLPLGILNFRIKSEIQEIWDWNRVVVVSEFPAKLPWQARNAMRRNATICALSDALVVVEAGTEGGTIEAGKTGLELGLPVFALQYNGDADVAPGNRILQSLGAHPLGRSRASGRGNVDRLLEMTSTLQRGHLSLL